MSKINIVVAAQTGGAIKGLNEVTAATRRTGAAVKNAQVGMGKFSGEVSKSQIATRKFAMGSLQQAGYQIGDYAVQVANGTSQMQAFGQQAPQLLQIFGPIGAVVGAGVAIFSAFGVAMQKTSGIAKSVGDALDEVSGSIEAYISLASSASKASADFFSGAQEFAASNSTVIKELIQIEKSKAYDSITKLNKTLYAGVNQQSTLNQGVTSLLEIGNTSRSARRQIAELTNSFTALSQASDLNSSYEAALNIKKQFTAIVGPIDQMSAAQKKFYGELLLSIQKMELLGATAGAEERMRLSAIGKEASARAQYVQSRIAGAFLAEKAEMVSIERERLARAQFAKSMIAAQNLAVAQNNVIVNKQMSAWGEYYQSRVAGEYLVAKAAADAANAPQVGRSRGRGGPTSKELELYNAQVQLAKEEERIRERLAKLMASGAKSASVAPSKLAKTINTELSPAMKRLKEIQESVGQSFENAMMSAVDGTKSVKDAFKSMASEIIKELYRVFVVKRITGFITNAIGAAFGPAPQGPTPSGAPVGRFDTLTFAGGGYTGNGARAGGLDGKGGFMAMMHPRESVVDHTKGQSSGGVTVIQNNTFGSGVSRAEVNAMLPKMVEATKAAVVDAKRQGGSYGRAFA